MRVVPRDWMMHEIRANKLKEFMLSPVTLLITLLLMRLGRVSANSCKVKSKNEVQNRRFSRTRQELWRLGVEDNTTGLTGGWSS